MRQSHKYNAVIFIISLFLLSIFLAIGNFYYKTEKEWGFEIMPTFLTPSKIFPQSIHGKIVEETGSCMPPIIGECIKRKPLTNATISIFSPPIKQDEMSYSSYSDGRIYKGMREPFIIIKSNSQGNYEVSVPTGSYSIFVEYRGEKSCGSPGYEEFPCYIEIPANEKLEFDIRVGGVTH